MDLILWRHADAWEAKPGQDDLSRALTPRGEKQAQRVGQWLDQSLPEGTRILCSPALRCEQTVRALGRKFKLRDALSPGSTVDDVLESARWPVSRNPVLVVGHQPTLGAVIAHLLQMQTPSCSVRKGAVWWLRLRQKDGQSSAMVLAVMHPDKL